MNAQLQGSRLTSPVEIIPRFAAVAWSSNLRDSNGERIPHPVIFHDRDFLLAVSRIFGMKLLCFPNSPRVLHNPNVKKSFTRIPNRLQHLRRTLRGEYPDESELSNKGRERLKVLSERVCVGHRSSSYSRFVKYESVFGLRVFHRIL